MLPHLYFAYGSNLYLKQMHERCPGHQPVGKARLPGWHLAFTAHSHRWGGAVATIVPVSAKHPEWALVDSATGHAWWHDHVPGAVYRLSDEHMQILDGFEEHPDVYRRTQVTVELHDGITWKPTEVITYIRPLQQRLPGAPVYVDTIARGYVAHGLDPEHLFSAAFFRPDGW